MGLGKFRSIGGYSQRDSYSREVLSSIGVEHCASEVSLLQTCTGTQQRSGDNMFSEKRKLLKKHKFVLLKRKFLKKHEVYESTRFIKTHTF